MFQVKHTMYVNRIRARLLPDFILPSWIFGASITHTRHTNCWWVIYLVYHLVNIADTWHNYFIGKERLENATNNLNVRNSSNSLRVRHFCAHCEQYQRLPHTAVQPCRDSVSGLPVGVPISVSHPFH